MHLVGSLYYRIYICVCIYIYIYIAKQTEIFLFLSQKEIARLRGEKKSTFGFTEEETANSQIALSIRTQRVQQHKKLRNEFNVKQRP